MTTNKKIKKHLIKDVKKNKKSKRRSGTGSRSRSVSKHRTNKINSSSISDLYTYESLVTNKSNSNNSDLNENNVNVINGLKDYLAIKK